MPEPRRDSHFFLDEAERSLVGEALRVIETSQPAEAELLRSNLLRLTRAAELVAESPPIAQAGRVGARFSETLLEVLCEVPEWDLELHLPMRVIFGRAYLVAKINFLKSLCYGLEAAAGPAELRERAELELGQSIYSKLAEELFTSIVTDASGEQPVKLAAARSLFHVWEERLTTEIDDFAPVLESVWRARNKVRPVVGTTLGVHELFRLLRECQDARFLEYFAGDVPEEQIQAFEEFLFGLSFEQLEALRQRMREARVTAVGPEEARAALPPSWSPRASGPQALYSSYKKRKVKAQYRVLTSTPGPRRTAEEFVMIAFLKRDAVG